MLAVFKQFCTETVTIEPFTGRNQKGSAEFGDATSHKARVEPFHAQVPTGDGKFVQASTRFFIDPLSVDGESTLSDIAPEDRIAHGGRTPRILSVDKQHNIAGGLHHFEVVCG